MKQLLIVFFLLSRLSALCQNESEDCSAIRNGVFYCYPKNTTDQYLIEKQGQFETDVDLIKGDSCVWKVDWKKNCEFTLQYLSGNMLTDVEITAFKKHKIAFRVLDVTNNYYTYSSFLDKTSGVFILTDTTWTHPKTTFSNSITYELVAKHLVDSLSISDTSKYALVYIYRPPKILSGILDNCVVELNGETACISVDPSIYVYRLLKEGTLEISSTIVGQKRWAVLPLEVKFGHKYYIRSLPIVSLATIRGWEAALYNIDPITAQEEINKIPK
jgi:hypothetical protein